MTSFQGFWGRFCACTNKDSKIKEVGLIWSKFQTASFIDSTLPKLVNTNFKSDVRRYDELFDLFFCLTFSPTLRNYIFRFYPYIPTLQMMTLSSKIPLHTHADNSTTKKEVTSCVLDNFQDLHFRFHIKSYVQHWPQIKNDP